jgi:hypothetical protein
MGEPLKLFVPLNFDEGDPVEIFTRATPTTCSSPMR